MNIKQLKTITAIQGDCMEYMKLLPDKSFDLAIIDCEYGIGASKPSKKPGLVKQKNGKILKVESPIYEHKEWDNKPADKTYFDELFRVSKHQIIWGCNYYNYPLTGGRIIWDKLNWYSDQMDAEIAYCSLNNRTDIVYYMWAGMMQGITPSKNPNEALIQQGNKNLNQKRIHPTEKPIKLYEWLLINYAKHGYKILDTHGGSMSHAIACHNLGYELTIIEKDNDYYTKAVERLEYHQRQKTLFQVEVASVQENTQTSFL